MQRFVESAPLIKFSAMHRQRSVIVFLTGTGQPDIHHGGMDVSSDDIVVYGSAASVHHRTTGPCSFGSMSLTPDDLACKSYALLGRELSRPPGATRIRPDPSLLSHLRRLHSAAGRLAATAPGVLAHPEVARSLEEALTQAMIRCLSDGKSLEPDRRFRNRIAVMAKLEDFLGMIRLARSISPRFAPLPV